MSIHPLRKAFRKATGLDLHRYRAQRDAFSWLESMDIRTIIDIGANIGQTAKEMRIRFPKAQIYSFEPLKECFDEMNRAMAGDARFKSFNIGIGEKKGALTMHKNAYSPSSSILDMGEIHRDRFPHTSGTGQDVTIQIERLDDILKAADLARDILFKIDVQGYEDKAIRGSEQALRASKIVLIENSFLPLYKDQPLFADIYKMLTDLGFTYRGALWQKLDPKTGAVMFEDSLFLRE